MVIPCTPPFFFPPDAPRVQGAVVTIFCRNPSQISWTTSKNKVFEISIFRYFSTSMCIFLIVIMIMSFGVFYLKRRSKRHCHYRQNVFTFKSTLFWGLLHFVIVISLYVTFTSGKVQIFTVIRILMIFSHFIKSIVTIFENQTNLPELFTNLETNNRSSFSNETTFYPRQENFLPNLPFKQNARWVWLV